MWETQWLWWVKKESIALESIETEHQSVTSTYLFFTFSIVFIGISVLKNMAFGQARTYFLDYFFSVI